MNTQIGSYPQIWFTYGPQTESDEIVSELLLQGATGTRLTFSYGTPELQVKRARQVKRIARELGRDICIVADLQGEKCRLRQIDSLDSIEVTVADGAILTSGSVNLKTSPPFIPVQMAQHIELLQPGDVIVEGDGALLLKVEELVEQGVWVRPDRDGVLRPGRGLMIQRSDFRPKAITTKDRRDLQEIARSAEFDAVAISFVASARDLLDARKIIDDAGANCAIVAKLETALGLGNLGPILNEADAVIVARGDLALATPWEDLYANCSHIARECSRKRVPWIMATQLVEGLERFSFPTRAECSDLGHWFSTGAHGAMLSYETAFGSRPVDAVGAVWRIAHRYLQG